MKQSPRIRRGPHIPRSTVFSPQVVEALLVKSARCCCLCRRFKGAKLEIHHINPKASGGAGDEENGIPLCFDCHAEVEAYNDKHPRGRKYSPSELKRHRNSWFKIAASSQAPSILMADPAYRELVLARLSDRIAEGEAIHSAMKRISGKPIQNWWNADGETRWTPDQWQPDYQQFVEWRVRCLALQDPLAAHNAAFRQELERFGPMRCAKTDLEFGIATLRAIKKELAQRTIPRTIEGSNAS